MATITRSTKQGGTTSLQDGQTNSAADVETDMATIYTEFNGLISAANLTTALKASFGGRQILLPPPAWFPDPGGSFAEYVLNDGTNFGETWWAFDGTSGTERIYTRFWVPATYDGGSITIRIITKAASATSGTYVFQIAAARHTIGTATDESLTTVGNTGGVTTDSSAGDSTQGTITWSSSLPSAGSMLTLELKRLDTDAADTIATDIRVLMVTVEW